jgi:hypothetical protein
LFWRAQGADAVGQQVPAGQVSCADRGGFSMKRIATFIKRAFAFHSISSAWWLDQYDNFKPKH